jgi:DtxR family Mn-dependent transcriptional regulator
MKILKTLHGKGDIISEEGRVKLTKSGKLRGKSVVRRHRLAERLLTDVLDVSSEILDTAACAFEHVLTEDVEDRVCTLLGHPRFCPHNRSIPKGSCCKTGILELSSAIVPLNQVKSNHKATIAYISTKKYARLQKLMGFGVLPGTKLEILRKSPGPVIKVDETIIALESDVISDIYVRKVKKIKN